MTSIGETLRRERLRQGLDLQQLSESTKIGTRMLQAMESDDFTKLPGGVFTRSFIKQYAAALGMDPASLEPELKALHVAGDEGTRFDVRRDAQLGSAHRTFSSLSDRGPDSDSLMASAVWVLLTLLVCGGVYYIMNRDTNVAPARQQAAASPENKPEAKAQTIQPPSQPPPQSLRSGQPVQPTPPLSAGPVQVVLSASEPAWVSVTADGKSAYVGILQANEKKEISASERVKIVAGNAGGLEISLNGKALDSLGPKGQVRVVELTPAGAQVIPRTPPNPSPLL
ncbi:MAG: transcriptional regulator, family [Bryobacterales bacterium]|nr:transcriptional regulator, family [Bryobacterales bacterium]